MAQLLMLVVPAASLVSACVTSVPDDATEGVGGMGEGGAGGQIDPGGCDTPDTACPASKPHPGAPCQGALSCDYDLGAVVPWHFACSTGHWEGGPDCSMVNGGCSVPEPAETCSAPFSGSRDDLTVNIGPAGTSTFRAFNSGEAIDVTWGGQGSAMVFYRIQVEGPETPSCVTVKTTIAPEGAVPESVTSPVRLRCGETLGMYIVVPYGNCGDGTNGTVPTTLTLEIDGVGTTTTMVELPSDVFCEPL